MPDAHTQVLDFYTQPISAVPDKTGALADAFRLLRQGGRLVFTDLDHRPATLCTRGERCGEGSPPRHSRASRATASFFGPPSLSPFLVEDLTGAWGVIFDQRFACIGVFGRGPFSRASCWGGGVLGPTGSSRNS